ncbi:carbohydrate-binding module family 50 protein, partial [Parathielavia hyrcaniae]
RDAVLSLTYDPNTTTYCTWWVDLTTPVACSTILSENAITLETFRRWNPSVSENCGTLPGGRSYCVEAMFEPPPASTTTSTTTPTSTTVPGNGVSTPVPTQPGMISYCNKFHFVQQGQTCATIAALYSISAAQFIQWNSAAGSDCSGLWASTYACVGVIEGTPAPSTTTKPGNGVTTPTPTHPVTSLPTSTPGILATPSASGTALGVSGSSSGTELRRHAGRYRRIPTCVGLIAGNGIPTPTAAHPGMVGNCNKFAYVNPGDTCDGIGFWNGVGGQWVKLWNGIEEACLSIQANTYACVGVV